MTEAFVDLTGESSEKINLRDSKTVQMIDTGEFWSLLLRYHKLGCLLGCANAVKSN